MSRDKKTNVVNGIAANTPRANDGDQFFAASRRELAEVQASLIFINQQSAACRNPSR